MWNGGREHWRRRAHGLLPVLRLEAQLLRRPARARKRCGGVLHGAEGRDDSLVLDLTVELGVEYNPHMQTIQVVLEEKLLRDTDRVVRKIKTNRSALIREALREHLKRVRTQELEEQERRGYEKFPQSLDETEWVRPGGGVARLERGEVRFHKFAPPDKRRPVVVLTRPSSIPRLTTVTVAAITSTIRGVPSEVVLNEQDGMKGACAVNLHHVTTVQQDHLGPRITLLSDGRMAEICSALGYALSCLG